MGFRRRGLEEGVYKKEIRKKGFRRRGLEGV